MTENVLETPSSRDLVYMARGVEVDVFRPLFTGDVYVKRDPSTNTAQVIIVLQHPCALRVGGVKLVPRILAARIETSENPRSDWAKESVRVMPFPDLLQDGVNRAANFIELALIPSDELVMTWERVAILSEFGVNLLTQRWVNHNSRVVIKTITYNEQTSGPSNEADLEAEWRMVLDGLEPHGVSVESDFHEWIRKPWGPENFESRQAMLDDPQKRASVRRAMTGELKDRTSGNSGHDA